MIDMAETFFDYFDPLNEHIIRTKHIDAPLYERNFFFVFSQNRVKLYSEKRSAKRPKIRGRERNNYLYELRSDYLN